jgi:hypothetical protein
MQIKTRQLGIVLTLATLVMLASCNKKPDDSASNPPDNTTTASPSSTDSSEHPVAASRAKYKATIPAAAAKLGVPPSGETTCPSNAPVKGKVTKKRGNIYHLAKTPDYGKTKPDICFLDKATAEQAGFRAPKSK